MPTSQLIQQSASAPQDYLQCSHEVVCGLIETASAALLVQFPKAVGDTFDIELVLDALRVFRPKVAEIGMFDALLHMAHGRWNDAVHVLRAVVDLAPNFAYAKAAIAYCLASNNESGWRQWANSALESNPSRETLGLLHAIEVLDNLQNAMRNHRDGEFKIPDSCQPLADQAQAAEPPRDAAPASSLSTDPQFTYLRA